MAFLTECDPAVRDVAPLQHYVFDVNGRFLEVQADNDLLAYALVLERFPRGQAVLLTRTDA